MFSDQSNRNRHEQTMHGKKGSRSKRKQERIQCPLCSSTFGRLDNLNLHLKRIHNYKLERESLGLSEKRYFECFHCNERFTLAEKENLLDHLVIQHFPHLKSIIAISRRQNSLFYERTEEDSDGNYSCKNCHRLGMKKMNAYQHVRTVSWLQSSNY